MSDFDRDEPPSKTRLLHIALEIHEDSSITLPDEVRKKLTKDVSHLEGVMLALLLLQGNDLDEEIDCGIGPESAIPCGKSCQCYTSAVASAGLEVIMGGSTREQALQFIFEEFLNQFEKPTILH